MMNLICSAKDECDDKTCPHAQPHDGCDHTCDEVEGARCVMDTAGLPEFEETGTIAVMIWRRKAA